MSEFAVLRTPATSNRIGGAYGRGSDHTPGLRYHVELVETAAAFAPDEPLWDAATSKSNEEETLP